MEKRLVVLEKIKELIVQEFGKEMKKITEDSGFHDDFGIDSLDALELYNQVETEFNITISDQATQELRDVKSLVNYVTDKVPDTYFEA